MNVKRFEFYTTYNGDWISKGTSSVPFRTRPEGIKLKHFNLMVPSLDREPPIPKSGSKNNYHSLVTATFSFVLVSLLILKEKEV